MRDSELGFFIVGIACGAAIGLAFAPMAGAELRDRIAVEAKEGARIGKAVVDRGKEARGVAADAKDLAERMRQLRRPL